MAEADDAMRERLREAMVRDHWFHDRDPMAEEIAESLIAEVRAIVVADELRAVAADDAEAFPGEVAVPTSKLRARADVLDPR